MERGRYVADDVSMKHTAYPLQDILNDLQGSSLQVKILIIDACRTYMGARGGTDGFAPVFASKGTIIAFATSPGQTAKEKNGHGVFTKAILNHISTPSISIEELFNQSLKYIIKYFCKEIIKRISWRRNQ